MMSRQYFGTDGIRGRANTHPMTAELALRLGAAAGRYFRTDGSNGHRVVIGKDTRLSGYMLENALTAGLCSTGMNVILLGPVPTPGVGFLTRSMRADLGIMISASHNPAADNGIKFFGPDGFKLSDQAEAEIEAILDSAIDLAPADEIGRARRIEDGPGRYVEYAKTTLPSGLRLNGLKVVVDCAHGAAYRAAPEALWELGAEVIPLGVKPNGFNINDKVGSTHIETCQQAVREHGADIGISLDGDADRVMIVDETGAVADGDQLMALLAARWADRGQLRGGALVATVMSNLGLEHFMRDRGLRLERTAVGDRYVVERMRAGGYNLGGEQSGHIVMTDYATTGDGLLAALQVMAGMVEGDLRASDITAQFTPIPQMLKNLRYEAGSDPLTAPTVQEAIRDAENQLAGKGRVLIRKSGTEPLIRVMAECEDPDLMQTILDQIINEIETAT